jgi:hypothetical protein
MNFATPPPATAGASDAPASGATTATPVTPSKKRNHMEMAAYLTASSPSGLTVFAEGSTQKVEKVLCMSGIDNKRQLAATAHAAPGMVKGAMMNIGFDPAAATALAMRAAGIDAAVDENGEVRAGGDGAGPTPPICTPENAGTASRGGSAAAPAAASAAPAAAAAGGESPSGARVPRPSLNLSVTHQFDHLDRQLPSYLT